MLSLVSYSLVFVRLKGGGSVFVCGRGARGVLKLK